MVKEQEPNIEQSKLDLADRLCGLGLLSASASELFFKQATHIMNLNGCDYKREFKKVYKEFLLQMKRLEYLYDKLTDLGIMNGTYQGSHDIVEAFIGDSNTIAYIVASWANISNGEQGEWNALTLKRTLEELTPPQPAIPRYILDRFKLNTAKPNQQ